MTINNLEIYNNPEEMKGGAKSPGGAGALEESIYEDQQQVKSGLEEEKHTISSINGRKQFSVFVDKRPKRKASTAKS